MDFLNYNSVETLPGYEARAAFTVNSATVFKEDVDIVPTIVDDTLSYIPWGGDNQMPFDLLALVEKDETLATCQCFITASVSLLFFESMPGQEVNLLEDTGLAVYL